MDFRLLLDVAFLLSVVSGIPVGMGFAIPYVFLPNRGLRLGFTSSQSSWLISVVGIFNIVGRIVSGYVANMKCVNRLALFSTIHVVCGIWAMFSVLLRTFPLLICYSVIHGICSGKWWRVLVHDNCMFLDADQTDIADFDNYWNTDNIPSSSLSKYFDYAVLALTMSRKNKTLDFWS